MPQARVVIEFSPVEFFTYSSGELDDALLSSGFDQWGEQPPRPGRLQRRLQARRWYSRHGLGSGGGHRRASIPTRPST